MKNLLYAIYDPFACGSNLVTLTDEKPNNVSIFSEKNEWTYRIRKKHFERNIIGSGARVPKGELYGTAMVIEKDNPQHLENLKSLLKELGLELINPPDS